MKPIILAGLLAGCVAHHLHAAPHEITNRHLAVRYDDTAQTFTVTDRATGRTFLTNGRLKGKGKVEDNQLVVTQPDGRTTLALRDDQPFVFVTKELRNTGTATLDIAKAVTATFTLDLGKPASALRTVGTGGLLPPHKNPGSYLFLTCADPATRNGVVAGWVTQDRGSGVVFSDVKAGRVEFKAQIDYGHLRIPASQSARLETLAIGYFADARIGAELYADLIQQQYDIKLRPRTAVYCTWYADQHGGAGNDESTVDLAQFIAKELKHFGLGVIQIDDHWQSGPQLDGPRRGFERARQNGPYPRGIAPVAAEVDKLGLTLGLWWLPFGRNHADPAWKDRQDWFAKWANGKPMRTRGFGGTCLDLTHPEVQKHLAGIAKLYRDWGVKYYKMDGLWTGTATEQIYINDGYKDDHMSNVAPFRDPAKTQIEAYRNGLKLLRQSAGNDVFFSGCCVSQNMRSFGGSIGLVDAMRIGPDFNHDGQGIKTGPLRASRLYFLNGRVWWNDPDPTKVRASKAGGSADPGATGAVSLDMAQLTTSFSAITGQFFLLSDWIPRLPPERIAILKRTMLSHTGTVRPVDYFDHPLPSIWHLESGPRHVLGLFNWEDKPQTLRATLAKTGLDPATTYHAFDFWKNSLLPDIKDAYAYELRPGSCKVIAVRAAAGRPVLLSTSRHVTQGIVDVTNEQWATNTLSGTSELIVNDPYELRIRIPAGWKLDRVTADYVARRPFPLTVTTQQTPGLARVTFQGPEGGAVQWQVSFIPVPKSSAASVTGLKAAMKAAGEPVILTWNGTAPVYDIWRNDVVIANGHSGRSYTDETAPAGHACTYAVLVNGGDEVATTTITTKAFNPGPVPPPPAVSLMKLKPVHTACGWSTMKIGQEVDRLPLKLAGKTYTDGIGLHADGEAVYARRPEWKRFVAVVGLDDSQRHDPRASIVCKVVSQTAAGKLRVLAQTPVLQTGKAMQWHFNVTLPADCAKLRLVVEDADDGNACDHADWVNAGFIK